jgi:LPXTG-motif cell wall-anchored protein
MVRSERSERREPSMWRMRQLRRWLAALASIGLVGGLLPGVPLLTGTPAALAEANPTNTLIRFQNVFYAYTQPGENLDVNFTKFADVTGALGFTITVSGPGGEVFTCNLIGTEPVGTGCNLPNLTSPVAGAWEIDFGAPSASLGSTSGDYFTWAINVQDAGSTNLPGRVWTEQYVMAQHGTHTPGDADFSLWYQSQEGFLYQANFTDFNGVDSITSSNATGNALAGTCVSAYESYDTVGPYLDPQFWTPTDECGDRYKLFFQNPDPALPSTTVLPDGTTTWLQPDAPLLPELTNLQFTQSTGTLSRSGTFTFDSANFTGQASLQVDANNDGDYSDPEDRTIPIAVTQDGAQSVAFDGLDGLGNPIPTTATMQARVRITQAGEIHFSNWDVEKRGALEVIKLNGPEAGTSTLYWDDSNLRTADRLCTTPQLDGTAGVPSAGGVHGWPCNSNTNNGITGSWGDGRQIDDWTYHIIDEQITAVIPAVPTLTQTKALDGAPVFDPATGQWTIQYLITETATGVGTTTYNLDDQLMYGPNMNIVGATVAADTPATPAPATATWNGQSDLRVITAAPIAAGDVHVYRATVVVELTAPQGGAFGECNAGEDFANRATLTPLNGLPEIDDACGEPTTPTVVLDKDVVSTTYNPTTLEYTITYNVSAVASGTGQTFYNATDAMNYGPNIDITGVTITPTAGTPAADPGWNGEASTTIVTNQPIAGGDIDRWTVVVTAELLPTFVPTPGTCEAGNDFYNQATLTIVGETATQTDDECVEVLTPTVSHDKRLLGAWFDSGTGQWTIDYAIDVVAAGQGTGFYDLGDAFQFGPTITIVGSPTLTAPAGVTPLAGWNGQGATAIVDDQGIGGGVTHTYLITVVATVLNPPPAGDCQAGEDFYNESTLVTGGQTTTDDECVEPSQPALAHDKTADSVTFVDATDEYVVDYTITVTATGTGNRSYDLFDTIDFPANMTITDTTVTSAPAGVTPNVAWDGDTDPQVAAGVNIVAGETDTYTIEIRAQLTSPDPIPNLPPPMCSLGSDFVNRSTVVAGADVLDDNDCFERPQPVVTPNKFLVDANLDEATGVYTLLYDIDVAASGTPAGQTFYDLADEFDFGPTVNVISATATSGTATLVGTWTGEDPNALLVNDQLITSGETQSVSVTVALTLTGSTPGNDPAVCAAGMDLHNDATVNPDGPNPIADSECLELPAVAHTKTVESGPTPVPGQPGRYSVTYLLTETETVDGQLPAAYDLTDQLRYGPDVTIISVEPTATTPSPLAGLQLSWDGQGNTLLVDNGVLQPGETHTLRTTVIVESLQPDPTDPDGAACSGGGTGLDEDLANTSSLTSNGNTIVANGCVPVPHPSIDHNKTLTGITPNGDGTYTVVYSVVATNSGDGTGLYDLGDTLRYGAGVQIVGQPTVTATPASVNLLAGWNGISSTGLVDDQPIDPAGVHTYTLTVVVRPDPNTTIGGATDCGLDGGESGTGVRNESTLTWSGGTQDRTACGELPHFMIDKAISSGPTDLGNGQHQLGYAVTVTNDGAGAGVYDLVDHLTYGSNITIASVGIVNTAPGGVPINPAWNGQTDTTVATGVNLASAGVHTYAVTVAFTVAPTSNAAAADCTLDPGEGGTGLLNTATVNNNGDQNSDTACAQVVLPPPPPGPTPTVPPTSPDPGQLPATGGSSTPIAQMALALIALGGLTLVLTRRRRRQTLAS